MNRYSSHQSTVPLMNSFPVSRACHHRKITPKRKRGKRKNIYLLSRSLPCGHHLSSCVERRVKKNTQRRESKQKSNFLFFLSPSVDPPSLPSSVSFLSSYSSPAHPSHSHSTSFSLSLSPSSSSSPSASSSSLIFVLLLLFLAKDMRTKLKGRNSVRR